MIIRSSSVFTTPISPSHGSPHDPVHLARNAKTTHVRGVAFRVIDRPPNMWNKADETETAPSSATSRAGCEEGPGEEADEVSAPRPLLAARGCPFAVLMCRLSSPTGFDDSVILSSASFFSRVAFSWTLHTALFASGLRSGLLTFAFARKLHV